jgi:hypothetical protein
MKKYLLLLATVGLFLFTETTIVNAAIINVPADQPTIPAAITIAVSGDVIQVSAGTYTVAGLIIPDGVRLSGECPANCTIVSTANIILNNNSELTGFTITRQLVPFSGLSITVVTTTGGTNMKINNCYFISNRTAIYVNATTANPGAIIEHNDFYDNRTGILFADASQANHKIIGNNIVNNRTFGVLFLSSITSMSNILIKDNNFTGNLASQLEINGTGAAGSVTLTNNWFGIDPPVINPITVNGGFTVDDHNTGSSYPYNFTDLNGSGTPPDYPNDISGNNTAAIATSPTYASSVIPFVVITCNQVISDNPVATYFRITDAINFSNSGATLNVGAGTYVEDVNISKTLTLIGAGASTTTISGAIGGSGSSIQVGANNVTIAGFTITRQGNNPVDWNGALNTAGISIQGLSLTGTVIRDNIFFGNRTGIDINASGNHIIRNNIITDNRTGMVLRNQTDNLTIIENEITNNWTVGFVFLDASGGTNSPPQTALNCLISNNNISGNWYGQIVDRQTGGSLPLPGANMKNFSGNWLGTTTPVVSTANSTEPGYAAQIPVAYGGTATAPGGQPDICGPASANIDYSPMLMSGTDMNVETVTGRGTNGFQGDFSNLLVDDNIPQSGTTGRIQEGINMVSGSTVNVAAGTYIEPAQLVINKNINLLGASAATTFLKPGFNTTNGGNVQSEAFIYVDPTTTAVVMKNFTIDCSGKNVHHAIQSRGALDIEDCIIQNVKYTDYAGRGIVYYGGNSGNLVKNVSFNNIERIGVHIRGNVMSPNPIVNIDHMTYVGKGPGTWLDYAVEFGAGGQGTVEYLNASNCGASSSGWSSAGVLVTDYYGAGTVAAINNSTFTDNEIGIADGYDQDDGSIVTATHNTFLGIGLGIQQTGAIAVIAEGNYWGSILEADVMLKASGDIDYAPWCNSTFTMCAYDGGPTTYAPKLIRPSGSIVVPIKVTTFNNVTAIALKLGYDDAKLDYVSTTLGPNVPGGAFSADLLDGRLVISYYRSPGFHLDDNDVLFNVTFTYDGTGQADFTWTELEAGSTDLEYARPVFIIDHYEDVPYYDYETSLYYIPGYVTNGSLTFTRGYTPGQTITATATGGTPDYIYSWTGPAGFTPFIGNPVVPGPYGDYTVTATDADGATIVGTYHYDRVHNISTMLDYHFIQAAHDAATATFPSQIIVADPGLYEEVITLAKRLDIRGPNYGIPGNSGSRVTEAVIVPATILNLDGSPREWDEDPVIKINTSDLSLDGFKISGDNPYLDGYDYAGMDIDAGLGVYSEGNDVKFMNNIVEKFTYMGFYASGDVITPHYQNNVIRFNKFQNIHDLNQLGYGFAMYIQGTTAWVNGNVVSNCRTGIQIQPYRVINTVTQPYVSSNTFSVWRSGIYYNYAENGATAWLISANTVTACSPPVNPTGPVLWDGITAETIKASSDGGTIFNNIINGSGAATDNVKWWAVWGMRYKESSSTSTQVFFTNNDVTNVEIGFVHDAAADIVFTGNNLSASYRDISIQRTYNSLGVPKAYGGTNNIDATGGNNYNSVNSIGASLAQLFDIEDLINHKIDESWRGLVTVRANQLYVTPLSYEGLETTPKIQRGVDAAGTPGWTVNVKGGEYPGEVNINKALTILGPNAEITCNDTRLTPEARLYPTVNDPEHGVLLVITASNVDIRGLMFDGDNTGLSEGYSVGTADVNTSEGICNGTDGWGPFTSVDHLNIQNNYFKNFPYQGIYLEVLFNTVHAYNYVTCNKFENMWEGIQTYAIFTDISNNVFTGVDRAISTHGTNVDCSPFIPRISHNDIYVTWKTTYSRNNAIWVNYRRGTAPALSVDHNTIDCSDPSLVGKNYFGFYALTVTDDRQVTFSDNIINGAGNCAIGLYMSACPSNNVNLIGGTGSFNNIRDYGVLAVNRDATWGAGDAKLTIDHMPITLGVSGVGVKASADPLYTNTVTVNITNDCSISGGTTGILADGATASVNVSANDNTITGNTTGVKITNSASGAVNTSTITANGTGILVDLGGNLTSCANNFITSNSVAGVKIESTAGTIGAITNNDLSGNPLGNAIHNDAALISATCNWWGTNSVAGVSGSVTGPVTYDPWLVNGSDIGNPGFVPGGSCTGAVNLYVNDAVSDGNDTYTTAVGNDANPGTAPSPFFTITKAVNTAMEGTNIWIDAGTFPEQVFIDETVAITGVDSTKTKVLAPPTLTTVTPGLWGGTALSPIIYATGNSHTIYISQLMVDGGGGRNVNRYFGIMYYEANGGINLCKITGIRNTTFDGSNHVAFFGCHTRGVNMHQYISVANSVFRDYGKGAIVLDAGMVHGSVTNNRIYGQNIAGQLAQNGIQVSRGADANVTGNYIHYNLWNAVQHPHIDHAAGILLYGSGVDHTGTATGFTTTIGGNYLIGNEAGIMMEDGSIYGEPYFPNMNTVFTGDNFTNNKVHVRLDNVGLISGSNNYDKRVDNITKPTEASRVYGCIQYAIDEATPAGGDVLNASTGTFVENVVVHTPVIINGAGMANTTVIPAISAPNTCVGASLCPTASNVFLVQASNITIQNLTVDGDNPAISTPPYTTDARNGIITDHLNFPSTVFNNLNVNNVKIKNIYLRGLYASTGGSFDFQNNIVDNVAGEANSIGIFNFYGAGLVKNNVVTNCNDGIASNWSSGTTYELNNVSNSGTGIHTDNNGGSGGNADVITNNTISNSPANGYGIFVYAPYKNVLVEKNTITNVEVGLTSAGSYSPTVLTTFNQNTVDGQMKANSIGVYSTTEIWGYTSGNQNVVLTNNFIKNNVKGFLIASELGYTNTTTANENSITGNTTGIKLVKDYTEVPPTGAFVLDFNCNWWGLSDFAGVATAVGASNPPVDYAPWLVDGTDYAIPAPLPGFQPVPGSCSGNPIISGTLKYNNPAKTPMNGVTLILKNSSDVQVGSSSVTNGSGVYTFTNDAILNGNYTIEVTNNPKAPGSINSTDAAQVNYWSIPANRYFIEYTRFLAGDVWGNGFVPNYAITPTDAENIQLRFVNGPSFVFNRAPWSYWKAGQLVNNNGNLGPIAVTVNNANLTQNLYGQVTGDFNMSYIWSGGKGASDNLSLIYAGSQQAGTNAETDLAIRIVNASELGAASLILNFPANMMEIINVTMKENYGQLDWAVKGDELRIGWNSIVPLPFSAGEDLFILRLKTSIDFLQGQSIRITLVNDQENELAGGDLNVIPNAVLSIDVIESNALGVPGQSVMESLTLTNQPNPFAEYTMLSYTLPCDGRVSLEISDMLGRKVAMLVNEVQSSGKYSVKLDAVPLQPGIYNATLILQNSNGDLIKTIKLVRNR